MKRVTHVCKCIHSCTCFNFDRVLHIVHHCEYSYLFCVNNPPSSGSPTRFFSPTLLLPYKRLWPAPTAILYAAPRPTSPTSNLSSTAGKPAVSRNLTAAGRLISRLIYRIPDPCEHCQGRALGLCTQVM